MKLKYTVLPAAVAVLFSAVSMAAPGPTGKITLWGTIKAPTCEVEGGASFTKNIGDYEIQEVRALSVGSEIHTAQSFDINLKGCTGESVEMSMLSETASEVSGKKYLTINGGNGAAAGVGVVLRSNSMPLNYDGTHPLYRNIVNGEASYTLKPSLIKTATSINPGTIQAEVNYYLTYR